MFWSVFMQENLFKKNAILVESDFLQNRLYNDILDSNGFEVFSAKSAMEGLQKIKENEYDLAVINVDIGEELFVEKLLHKIRSERSILPIVGLSIYEQEKKKNIAKAVNKFLTKPFSIDTFIDSVVVCVENGCANSCSG